MSTEKGNTEVDSGREKAAQAVFTPSQASHGFTNQVQGYDWSQGLDYEKLLQSYLTAGFQATSFGLAVQEVNKMVITNLC